MTSCVFVFMLWLSKFQDSDGRTGMYGHFSPDRNGSNPMNGSYIFVVDSPVDYKDTHRYKRGDINYFSVDLSERSPETGATVIKQEKCQIDGKPYFELEYVVNKR